MQTIDFANETDADLITLISWREDDADAAYQALGEFYGRYYDTLMFSCRKKLKSKIGDQGVEDLVHDVFIQIYEGAAKTFKTKEADPKRLRHQIWAWLDKIAFNLFLMILREKKRMREIPITKFDFPSEEPSPISAERAKQCEKLRHVVEGLSPREQDILLTKFANYEPSLKQQHFHPADLEQLAKDWDILPDHVRQILFRAIQKIKDRL